MKRAWGKEPRVKKEGIFVQRTPAENIEY